MSVFEECGSFNINFFQVHYLDLKVTNVGHDGTAQNFRPVPNIRASMNFPS